MLYDRTVKDIDSGVNITHVIFDLDGLIVDTERRYDEAYEKVCQKFGKSFTFDLKHKTTGRPYLETAEIIVRDLNLPISAHECDALFEASKGPRQSPLLPGAEALIRHLHRHDIPIAIATGSNRESYSWKSEPHQELFGLFSHVVNIPDEEEITRGKPDPQPFLVCASRFREPVEDASTVAVFEDALAGVQAANDAGMRSIWVPDPKTPVDVDTSGVVPYRRLLTLAHFKPEHFGIRGFE